MRATNLNLTLVAAGAVLVIVGLLALPGFMALDAAATTTTTTTAARAEALAPLIPKKDANLFLSRLETDQERGTFVDAQAAKVTVEAYAEK